VGCYVPVLTRCRLLMLHSSKRGDVIISKKILIVMELNEFKEIFLYYKKRFKVLANFMPKKCNIFKVNFKK